MDSFENVLAELKETHRMRNDMMRPRVALTNQIKAVVRRLDGDEDAALPVTMPLYRALEPIVEVEKEMKKRMERLGAQLPASNFGADILGFGSLNFAQIVAETGDLWRYPTVAKLWKRMGLAVVDGKAQRRVRGDEALEHGFSPHRRAVMANVATSLMTKQNRFKLLYDERKVIEQEKLPDGPPAHVDARARRYMVKRLLRELWSYWRETMPIPLDLRREEAGPRQEEVAA